MPYLRDHCLERQIEYPSRIHRGRILEAPWRLVLSIGSSFDELSQQFVLLVGIDWLNEKQLKRRISLGKPLKMTLE